METEIIQNYKLSRSKFDENIFGRESCKKKNKRKGKELRDRIIEFNETEITSKLPNNKPAVDKTIPFEETNPNNVYLSAKTHRNPKSRHAKYILAKSSSVKANQPFSESGKIKFREKSSKLKSGSRHYDVLSALPKIEANNTPVVVLHHRGEKPFKKSKEHLPVLSNGNFNNDHLQTRKKNKTKSPLDSSGHAYVARKEDVYDNANLNHKKHFKERGKPRPTNRYFHETPNVFSENKIELNKHKYAIGKGFIRKNNPNSPHDSVINKLNNVPVRIEDKPLGFMKLFRIASVFQGYKDKKKYDEVIKLYCEKAIGEEKYHTNKSSKPSSKKSLRRLAGTESTKNFYSHEKKSAKRLKGLRSKKSIRQHKNTSMTLGGVNQCSLVALGNTSDNFVQPRFTDNQNYVKPRKVLKKRKINHAPFERLKTKSNKKIHIKSILSKQKFNLIQGYQNSEGDVYLRNMNCGDGAVRGETSQSSSQNKKLSTIYSESVTTSGLAEKESTEVKILNNDLSRGRNEISFSKVSKSLKNNEHSKSDSEQNSTGTNNLGKISIVKPTLSEDGKKITFQVVKSKFSSRNIDKLNKHLSKLNNKHLVKASKGNVSMKNDRLMLFYAKQAASCTSQDSLNIAISKDTEVSNDGGSNSVLKVVIKQTNSVSSNSKTATLTDLEVDNDNGNVSNIVKHNVLNRLQEKDDLLQNCKGFERSICLGNTESENTTIITDSQEPDSKRSIISGNKTQNRMSVSKNEAGLYILQNGPNGIERNGENFKKSHSLMTYPETTVVSKVPSSMYVHDYNSVTTPVQKGYIKCAQKSKYLGNSPKRKQFSTISSPKTRIESFDKNCTTIGKLSSKAKGTTLAEIKYKYQPVSPRNPINNNLSCDNYKQSLEDLEHIQLKLQQIGVTHKENFVKVIDAENEETCSVIRHDDLNSVENQRLCQLTAKTLNTSLLPQYNKKQNDRSSSLRAQQYSLKNVGNCCDSRIKHNDFKTKGSLDESSKNKLLKNFRTVENKQNDKVFTDTKKSLTDDHSQEDLGKQEELKIKRKNFVTILPKTTVDLETPVCAINVTECHLRERAAEPIEEVPLFTEAGVQTDHLSDQLREQLEHSVTNTNDHLNPSNKCRETSMLKNNSNTKQLFNITKTETVLSSPEKKISFIDIEQTSTTKIPTNEEIIVGSKTNSRSSLNKQPGNVLNESNTILNTLIGEKHHSDGRIVDKINAIYDFLQYLDTVLKNTEIIKPNESCDSSSNKIGKFNKTLRCLGTNCINILEKFDVTQAVEQEPDKHSNISKSPERGFSQYAKKRSLFVSEVSPQMETGWKTNEAWNDNNYVNIREGDTPFEWACDVKRNVFQRPSDKFNRNPFIFVVPSNESLDKTAVNKSTIHVKNQSREYLGRVKKKDKTLLTTSSYSNSKIVNKVESKLNKKTNKFPRETTNFNVIKGFDDAGKHNLNNHKKKVDSESNYVKNCKSPASKIATRKTSICKSSLSKVGAIEIPKRSTTSTKPVISDLYLEKFSIKTVKQYPPNSNNQPKKHNSTIYKSTGFGDSESCYVGTTDDSVYEKSLGLKEKRNIENYSSTSNNGRIEKQANQRNCHISTTFNNTTTHALSSDISKSTNTLRSSVHNRKITKDDSACPNIVKKMCSKVFKTIERNIVGSVSKNRLSQNNDMNKSNSSLFQRLRNNTSKLAVKKQTTHNHVQEEMKLEEQLIRYDSDESVNSYAFSDCLHQIKDKNFSRQTTEENTLLLESVKNDVCQYNNSGQDKGVSSESVNKSNCENHESSRLKNVISNFSMDSSFSQNKETLVFTNKKLSCSAELHECVEPLCYCLQEKRLDSKKEAEVTRASSVCDSTGWISISSCDLLNKRREDNLNNNVGSSDLEKVRVQMDINMNDVMHVEFFCQPSDSVAKARNKNSLK